MTLAQIPEIGFFVQNSRIGVKLGNLAFLRNWTLMCKLGEPVLSTSFLNGRFIHKKVNFFEKSILSTFGNFAQNTVLSTLFANETFTRSFRQINHSSL